ncbi:MAG: SusC/RagA family TonB-linked outer membrane protein [Bacteroidota bacterium]
MKFNCKSTLLVIGMLFSSILAFGQNASLSGDIKDNNGDPIIGATIRLDGTSIGTFSDVSGNYSIENIAPGTYDVIYSFVGFSTIKATMTFSAGEKLTKSQSMSADAMLLDEAVVIGYGTTNSKDLTGSTKLILEKDFQSGNVTTPEQLITGKVSGVQITSNDGAPGSGSRIRIRGGTSLNASNDPLIVIDEVPVDNEGIDGAANALNMINPNDIESMVVLKDASATAIYGSRGANGVILITTKKGAQGKSPMRVNLQQNFSLSTVTKTAEVMNAAELREAIIQNGDSTQLSLLGNADTDWQNEIYRNAFISESNLNITGGIENLPYRLSIGYKHEEGILRRHQLDRTSIGLNLNPKFLDDKLAVSLNTKLSTADNFFANQDAIGAAVSFDPTQSVLSGNEEFGGYFEWLNPDGTPSNLAGANPVGLLEQKEDISDVLRFIGNLKLDYELPFFPEVHAVMNIGGDFSKSSGSVVIDTDARQQFFNGGERSQYEQTKSNRLLETYFNYQESFGNNDIDFTAGYSYQRWERETPAFPLLNFDGDTVTPAGIPFQTENALISLYGRLKYTLNDKYLLTATLRRDGSSRFNPDQRWGMFPSAAFAWRISEENFLKESKAVSYLKLRAGYGVTGQQDIGNDYPYLANYTVSTSTAQYQFGNTFYELLRPDGFDFNIKWEETTSTNIGLDFGFMKNRLFGSIDYYIKQTDDLLTIIDVPAGVNFTNEILTNVGSMENKGFEFELSYVAISEAKKELIFGMNLTSNRNEVTKLSRVVDPSQVGILTGGIDGGIGNNVQIHAVGNPTNSFYVYEQIYDEAGNPLEGQFVDRNNDGIVNEMDRYIFEKPAPDFFLGFFTNYRLDRWTAGFALRGEFDRFVYNNVNSNRGFFESVPAPGQGFITNLNNSFNESGFITSNPEQFLSDYYLEKANFIRMDYFNVGYDFGKVFKESAQFNAGIVINNVFVLSDYSGIDPEVADGIDKNIYPRPRIYSLNLNFTF